MRAGKERAMKKDIINGFEYRIYSEDEVDEARAAVTKGEIDSAHALIATKCSVCHEYIEKKVNQRGPVQHSEAYHMSYKE